jgi:quinohemoprotein ethanol dehydrogenase
MRLTRSMGLLVAGAAIATWLVAWPAAQNAGGCCTPAGSDWPKNGGNLGNQSASSLTQITKANIAQLGPAWVIHTSAEPVTSPVPGPGTDHVGQQTTPIAVGGVLYFDTPSGGVMALDGVTGAVRWKWQPSEATVGFNPATTRRGVSVGEGKVFTLSGGNRVVALDQQTGRQVWAVQPTANGETLGNTAKVATVYHDGLVYIGTNDSPRSAGYAVRASDGAIQWWFYGAYPHGTVFTDVNGNTFDAGNTWTTKTTPNDTPNDCYLTAGAAPWIHPSIDPELGMVYWTFGNVRSCPNSQNGSGRPGDNLFANSIVAMDAKTGAYKWHFQSVRHDIWDMDNVHAPLLADVMIGGQRRKVLYYGSKQGHTFVLDRTNGKPALGVEYRPVPVDSRQNSPATQPYPTTPSWMPQCLEYQNLGSAIPGAPNRAVPNYNGYQAEPDPAHPGQLRLVLRPGSYLEVDAPFLSGPPRRGCLNDGHWELPVLSLPSQNGGADWSNYGYSHNLNMYYVPASSNPSAHAINLFQGGNGLRAPGQYQSGELIALDASTNLVKWRKDFGPGGDVAHGNSVLVTASDLLFISRPDGFLLGLDAATGEELWRFQTGSVGASGVISYMVNGEQYIAVAAMGANQPYAPPGRGDEMWAFKLGGKAVYTTGPRSNPVVVSGSSEAPAPPPIVNLRRPVDSATWDGVPPNTIYLAYQRTPTAGGRGRGAGGAGAAAGRGGGPAGPAAPAAAAPPAPVRDSTATASMLPSRLTVPVGTTVTFINPGDAQLGGPNTGNQKEHCATQFFEGLFNFRLQPGQSAQYTFTREGEYYYNDCTDPRPTGKVIVTLAAEPAPLQFTPNTLDLRSPNGLFTGVAGTVEAVMTVPTGWVLDRTVPVTMTTPLTTQTFTAVSSTLAAGSTQLTMAFAKADIDNNLPMGDAVSLKVSANFLTGGVQKKLEGTATVRVVK